MKKVFVAGAGGFIGRNLVEQLGTAYEISAPTHAELELMDAAAVREYFRGKSFDAVIICSAKPGHRNAPDPDGLLDANTRQFFNIARNPASIGRLIFIGSGMQAISGYVELLRRGAAGPVNPQQDKYLKIIGDNAERFQSFIDNVIDLVKLGGGNLSISVVPFNPGDINKRIAELFGPQAQENGITLANTTAAGLPFAYGDPNRVYQIMVNLVTNAVKFTPAGGRIEIGAREDAGYVRMPSACSVCKFVFAISPEILSRRSLFTFSSSAIFSFCIAMKKGRPSCPPFLP